MQKLPGRLLTLSCLALLLPLTVAAKTFEGLIDMTMKDGRDGHTITYATKEGHLRMSMAAGDMGEFATLIDMEAGRMVSLIPQMNAYMVIPFDKAVEATTSDTQEGTFKKTGESTEILGYDCDQYLYEDKNGVVEIWATEELGQFVAMPKGNPMQGGKKNKPAGWETALPDNFFPMRLVGRNKRGKETMQMEVTRVQPKSLDDAMFEIPAGYKEFNMGAMMQGLMGGN